MVAGSKQLISFVQVGPPWHEHDVIRLCETQSAHSRCWIVWGGSCDYCQTSVLSLKTWSWLCFTPVTTTRRTTTRTPTKNLSCYWPDFDDTLKVASWEHLEQILTVTVTFVQATFVQVTFVHIRNISTVSEPILIKL